MEDKLKILIAYYEEEKSCLLKLIDDCLKEEEYQLAYFYQQALYLINGRLQTLRNLDDIFYDEKISKQRLISVLEKELEEANSNGRKEHVSKNLQKQKEALEKLNQTTLPKIASAKENIFDDTVLDLTEKKIKSFKLVLKKSDSFFLAFSYHKKTLKIVLPNVKKVSEEGILNEDKIKPFINLGFELINNQTKLILKLTGDKKTIIYKLKIILSKIVFEIFYFKEFQNESYIQIKTKASR